MHAVMVIDMVDATADEIRCVIRAVRASAARSHCEGWPDEIAVLVGDAADDVTARVATAVAEQRYPVSA